ncbi:E3 SUMO-protein ligase ZBED1-like isoform X2 [Nothobranchius furzeri]|uniref:E3 SUMO-protein ligase ZBED1-like isoform X2 n=1 Tax=Nothobranchius furzeri TaxID=105023 RepID=UPI003904A2E8
MKTKRKQIHQERTQVTDRDAGGETGEGTAGEAVGDGGREPGGDGAEAGGSQTVKEMMAKKHAEELERVKRGVQQAVAVSITADMWTSLNMEAYLALTCHYINDNMQLCTSVLGVKHFPQSHTADNLTQVKRGMKDDWAITNKVRCLVTDAAPNMMAATRTLQIRHSICIAHKLNLIVKKSCDQIPELPSIRHKSRQIVSFFRSSTTAKEKLAQVQQQMGRPTLKLVNEVPTRWNSTYQMLSRLHDEREPVWVSLASPNRFNSTHS